MSISPLSSQQVPQQVKTEPMKFSGQRWDQFKVEFKEFNAAMPTLKSVKEPKTVLGRTYNKALKAMQEHASYLRFKK